MKPDLLMTLAPRPHQLAQLEERFTLHWLNKADDPDALLARVGPTCQAMFANGHFHLDQAFLDKMPALKIVSITSAGYEAMDVEAMSRRGVWLTSTSEMLTDDVADTAIMLMLATRRRLVEGDAYVRTGAWGQKGMFPLTVSTAGKKVGILGLGRIGSAIAKRCEALGLEIGYFGRGPKDVPYAFFDTPEGLAGWSDILIAATAGGEGTAHLVSAETLAALGPAGTFVNISRGTVVDEEALIAALGNGTIASAGLDVFMDEPNPNPALLGLPNVTLYPHHASGTEETRDAMHQRAVDNLVAWFDDRPLLSPANRPD
ncbi:2-hydroxyacid dehydrogenase [Falsirhodobacter halotolerans]|uniref:2-hydroxyacid dehydrogenase n=1 Tax=Falsirhodobacter halotolerans TaxID=1146892 RepID=UPI001FD3EC34|nr:2-hydroxyacid dehydrogenase [Falsirhodobacter halotolerans]MCJ8140005.1 2-hydroxyacid dehydrogenase [Falsirhodobacter halotolerans]